METWDWEELHKVPLLSFPTKEMNPLGACQTEAFALGQRTLSEPLRDSQPPHC